MASKIRGSAAGKTKYQSVPNGRKPKSTAESTTCGGTARKASNVMGTTYTTVPKARNHTFMASLTPNRAMKIGMKAVMGATRNGNTSPLNSASTVPNVMAL